MSEKRERTSIIKMNIEVLKFVFKFCPIFVICAIMNVAATVIVNVAEVDIISKAITMVTNGSDLSILYSELIRYGIIIASCYIVKAFYSRYITQRYRTVYRKKMQTFLFNKVKKVDMESYDDPEFYDKFSRALGDSTWRGIAVFNTFVDFIQATATTIAIGTYVVLVTDFILLAIILASAVINVITTTIINKIWYKVWKKAEKDRRYTYYVKRTFYQQKFAAEIKTTTIGNLLVEKFDEKTYSIDKIYRDAEKKLIAPNFIFTFCKNIIEQAGTYIYLAYRLITEKITVAIFTATVNATFKFSANLVRAANVYTSLREHTYYISDFLWITSYEPKIEKDEGLKAPERLESLEIKDITFKYPRNTINSIDHLSMNIKRGQKIAIVGDNGGGKTTLTKLLLKFYNPTTGEIFLNGVNLKDYNGVSLRSLYAIIYQDFQIYAVTIAENVLMRRVESKEDEDRVRNALKMVGLLEKIESMKDGIYTQVTREFDKDGANFSGGERQRLVISRVFASDSDVYILDEPTAALDPFSEERINKLIIQNVTNKTMIIIAHRLSTVVDADIIYLIREGKIFEYGSHEELMNKKGRYYEMFTTQRSLYEKQE